MTRKETNFFAQPQGKTAQAVLVLVRLNSAEICTKTK